MKGKLKFIIPLVVLIVGGLGAYQFVLAKPPPEPKPKVEGEVYPVPKEFLLNLSGGRFAKVSVGLILSAPAAGAEGEVPAKPPEGYGALPQEALVRDIVTTVLTDATPDELVRESGREKLKKKVLGQLKKRTDVPATEVLFTDVAVQ